MAELLYRWGTAAARHARLVVGCWLVVLGLAGTGFAVGYHGLATSFDIPGTTSSGVIDTLAEELPDYAGASGTVVLRTSDGEPFTDAQRQAVSDLVSSVPEVAGVAAAVDPFAAEAERTTRVQQVLDGRAQIAEGRAQLDAGQAQLDAAQVQLDASASQLDTAREQALAAGANAPVAAIDAQLAQLAVQADQLAAQLGQLDAGREELAQQSVALETGSRLLDHAEAIRLVSRDGSTARVTVAFTTSRLDLPASTKDAVVAHFVSTPVEGVETDFSSDIAQRVPQVFGVPEAIGVLVAAGVLVVMLGAALAAALPIVTAITGVAIGVLGSLAFSGVVSMMAVTPVLGVMLGLAVGIDYSLFILNRHRRQLAAGAELVESIGLANGTAGNAVVFAGATVVVALLALNVTGVPFLGLMGTVGAACVAVAVLLATTLTPALLGLLGERALDSRGRARLAHHETTASLPMRTSRAVATAAVCVGVLLTLAVPALSLRVGLPDGSSEPADSTAHRAYAVIEQAFGAGSNATLLVTADLPEGLDDAAALAAQADVADALADVQDVVAVAPIAVSGDGTLAAFQVVPREGPSSESTEVLVRALRDLPPVDGAITLGVAGQAAINIDISERLLAVLPVYLALVVGLSLLIMVVVFRSLLVPVVATAGFVLSLAATFGTVVAVFQWGWFAGLLGVASPGPLLNFLPLIYTGVLFGLAMDYQLFLATGMREAFVHGAPARVAVVQGFRGGHTVVIAAGLIMVSVFGGFIFNESTVVRPLGFGLAFGVAFDAFVVRLLLMPAVMHLLDGAAWWLPRWLERVLPRVDVEGAALERKHRGPGSRGETR